jgi:hypothetical protein
MPRRISSPIAVAAAFVILGIGLDLHADPARMSDCLAAPNASAPQAQHWYYRIDRSSHRKCWYLHVTIPVLHRAMIKQVKHYEPSSRAGVAMPGSLADSAPRSVELGTFFGKLQPALVVSTTSEEPSPRIAQEENDSPSILGEPSPVLLQPHADAYIPDDTEGTPESSVPIEDAGATGVLRSIILLLVPVLAISGYLIPVAVKMVSERPIHVPETARVEYQFFHDRSTPRWRRDGQDERDGSDPRSREHSTNQHEGVKEPPSVLTRRSKTRSEQLVATLVGPLRSNSEGVERALHAIRQARQQQTA